MPGTERPAASKAVLLAHLLALHRQAPATRRTKPASPHRTLRELQSLHCELHHRYTIGHWHGIRPNIGADSRPEGWYTGEHVHERATR